MSQAKSHMLSIPGLLSISWVTATQEETKSSPQDAAEILVNHGSSWNQQIKADRVERNQEIWHVLEISLMELLMEWI